MDVSNAATRWLCLDGLVPLLGAGVLFIIWGFARFVTAKDKTKFSYKWWEAIDPMGWLYGAAILSFQSGFAGTTSENAIFAWACIVGGVVSIIILLSAMTNRGEDSQWRPPASLQIVAALLTATILLAGYKAHTTRAIKNAATAAKIGSANNE